MVGQRVGGGREGDAEDDEEDVGHGQVEDQEVGRVPHLLVEADDENNLVRRLWKFAAVIS